MAKYFLKNMSKQAFISTSWFIRILVEAKERMGSLPAFKLSMALKHLKKEDMKCQQDLFERCLFQCHLLSII